jgi:two-component system sensor histidine kinase/response regulator
MSVPSTSPVLDRDLALSRVGGDVDLLREIAVLFLDEYPKFLNDLRIAVSAGDARAIERTAHGLKGSVSHFGARAAWEAARSMEDLGRTQQLADAEVLIQSLEIALAALRPELEAL